MSWIKQNSNYGGGSGGGSSSGSSSNSYSRQNNNRYQQNQQQSRHQQNQQQNRHQQNQQQNRYSQQRHPKTQIRVRILKLLNASKKNFKNFGVNLTKCLRFYNLFESNSFHLLCYETAKYNPVIISSKTCV